MWHIILIYLLLVGLKFQNLRFSICSFIHFSDTYRSHTKFLTNYKWKLTRVWVTVTIPMKFGNDILTRTFGMPCRNNAGAFQEIEFNFALFNTKSHIQFRFTIVVVAFRKSVCISWFVYYRIHVYFFGTSIIRGGHVGKSIRSRYGMKIEWKICHCHQFEIEFSSLPCKWL